MRGTRIAIKFNVDAKCPLNLLIVDLFLLFLSLQLVRARSAAAASNNGYNFCEAPPSVISFVTINYCLIKIIECCQHDSGFLLSISFYHYLEIHCGARVCRL
jgi:hypothetical protein